MADGLLSTHDWDRTILWRPAIRHLCPIPSCGRLVSCNLMSNCNDTTGEARYGIPIKAGNAAFKSVQASTGSPRYALRAPGRLHTSIQCAEHPEPCFSRRRNISQSVAETCPVEKTLPVIEVSHFHLERATVLMHVTVSISAASPFPLSNLAWLPLRRRS